MKVKNKIKSNPDIRSLQIHVSGNNFLEDELASGTALDKTSGTAPAIIIGIISPSSPPPSRFNFKLI